ncbi:hypothetical protein Heshes_07830 [Alicyclobacillus hesperidum]|uniref:DUF1648 domain-containing protein n=1 Tax=Alicyclobacillus hesperidum TaxID=89784 RepID=A0A1H2WJP7_9BACL|nr:DUF1648 domain-containing protein [Alicyclobacillus hesperidum]GLV13099.1 hypothetical protein Heshes_07830 [Alicyclobacillus hesperidum]SDW80494.1 Protein of unknown function [Alicyclobacillus hesperidum]
MSDHLSLAQALSINTGIWITFGLTLAFVILSVVLLRLFANFHTRQFRLLFRILPLAPLFLCVWMLVSTLAGGWQVRGTTLEVRTDVGVTMVDLDRASADWVLPDGSYAPASRMYGTSAGNYQTGLFRLNNGETAVVYHVGHYPELAISDGHHLVLVSSKHVYMLAHRIAHVGAALAPAPNASSIPIHWPATVAALLLSCLFVYLQIRLARAYRDRLPEKVVSHWGVGGKANGWMSRKAFLRVGIMVAVAFGVLFSGVSLLSWVGFGLCAYVQLVMWAAMKGAFKINARDADDPIHI